MADAINKVTFTGLESQICVAFNMVDVLMDMRETHFCKSGDDNIIVTSTEAARLFFIACQAEAITHKLKKAYYEAWDNERGEGGAPGIGQLGALIAAHTAALADYDAMPDEDTTSQRPSGALVRRSPRRAKPCSPIGLSTSLKPRAKPSSWRRAGRSSNGTTLTKST
ncbi:hypothetical protein [Mesorhizobium huakuii]|uniref:Uncharacterized protein n=1 Tax=Mesorhizobium huakuii TaxID=28104 RepID=A0A7G6T2J8_9HYPH|nr:hypothetical protein [Mesorhizobium huakuii]QND60980.1 hypothetical protein HB778_34265 [Mesorhizobium huakuii]